MAYGDHEIYPTAETNVFAIQKQRLDKSPRNELKIGRSPCDGCFNAHRCGNLGLACSLFEKWVDNGLIAAETAKVNRDDPTAHRYDLIFVGRRQNVEQGSGEVLVPVERRA